MTEMEGSLKFTTYVALPSGVTAIPNGKLLGGARPTEIIVSTLVFYRIDIADTVPSKLFVTYTVLPSGVTATPIGTLRGVVVPTGIVVVSVFVFKSIIERVPSFW